MTSRPVGDAVRRLQQLLERRPSAGREADAPALARWQGGLRTETTGPHGRSAATDMPEPVGGKGSAPTPGWLMRAAIASCAVTRIAMEAAAEGLALRRLEARCTSESDARGLFAQRDEDGRVVPAAPLRLDLHVSIEADGASAGRLDALVRRCCALSPVGATLCGAVPIALQVDTGPLGQHEGTG